MHPAVAAAQIAHMGKDFVALAVVLSYVRPTEQSPVRPAIGVRQKTAPRHTAILAPGSAGSHTVKADSLFCRIITPPHPGAEF